MNKFIEQQLSQLKVAKIKKLSDTEFLIEKVNQDQLSLSVGNCYLIELEDYIIHPSVNFTLASNWNRGVIPASKTLKCMVTQILGRMVKVDGLGDHSDSYTGLWLPMGGVKIIEKIG